jgi:tRNA (cmo5U34)-methyltransferase
MTDAASFFDAQAEQYEAPRRRLVPPFDDFYGTAVEALDLIGAPPKRVLDLGAGTGMLSARVAAAHPGAELTLLDGAPAMLDRARELLGDRVETVVADLRGPLPGGGYCAVVSALAIHHLEDADKRALFARVRDALAPGGVFVNADQVTGPTPPLDDRYRAWHEARARAAGSSDEEWAGAEERMAFDRCADVGSQLAWLRDAGFGDVDCLFKHYRFAVMVARRPRED